MVNRSFVLAFVSFLALTATACVPHAPDPDKFAQHFFHDGRESILSALENQHVPPAQLDQAKSIITRYEQTVPNEIAAALRAHEDLLLAVTSGRDSGTLLGLEQESHRKQETALRSIGAMHEELQREVGAGVWQSASAEMGKKMDRFFRRD
jgi:hypothetical protein